MTGAKEMEAREIDRFHREEFAGLSRPLRLERASPDGPAIWMLTQQDGSARQRELAVELRELERMWGMEP